MLPDISCVALFDVIDCYTWQHGKWCRLCGCEGELCRPPCENGGRCLANEKGDWRCYCWPDFSGERCEVNHCTDYCLNGGTCMGSPLGKSTSYKHSGTVCVNKLLLVVTLLLWKDQTCWENCYKHLSIHRWLPISSWQLSSFLSLSLPSNKPQTSNFFHPLSGTTNLSPQFRDFIWICRDVSVGFEWGCT